jgi:hypothetical protein
MDVQAPSGDILNENASYLQVQSLTCKKWFPSFGFLRGFSLDRHHGLAYSGEK